MEFPNNNFNLTRKIQFNEFIVGKRYYFVLKEGQEGQEGQPHPYQSKNFFGTYVRNFAEQDDEDEDEDDENLIFYVLFNNVKVTITQDEANVNVQNTVPLFDIVNIQNDFHPVSIQTNRDMGPNHIFAFNFEDFDFYLVNTVNLIEGGKRKRTRRRRTRRRSRQHRRRR
jgi:hypothetical protein